MTRLGVDLGGTFTDLAFFDDATGELVIGKSATVPAAPEVGVANVVADTIATEAVGRAEHFLHGMTVGLNSLIERRGAVVGLLATAGFRDVLELARATRPPVVRWKAPPPLVPRHLRLPVRERILADGSVSVPLEAGDVLSALESFRVAGVECIACAFMNAHANPAHEQQVAGLLREAGFGGYISLSHEVTGEFREYERTSTTVIDAYIRPRVSSYLERLEQAMVTAGFTGRTLITRCGGGALSLREGMARPFETLTSGPVAGAVGAGRLARDLGLPLAITGDVGGTTFDACLIRDGEPMLRYAGEVEGMPVQSPWVDVRSIGAGGGSIVHTEGQLLRVGPQSAGAQPGPACYGRGGTEPTVTDAAAFLGMLGLAEITGGLTLDVEAGAEALAGVGARLGLTAEQTAEGVMRIVTASLAGAIKHMMLEMGEDPRDAAIILFGGAGPMLATLLLSEANAAQVVVPAHAGNYSAVALLSQEIRRSAARSVLVLLGDQGLERVASVMGELLETLSRRGVESDGTETTVDFALELRYAGQAHGLAVPVGSEGGRIVDGVEPITAAFAAEHRRQFGHEHEAPIEIMSVRATMRSALPGWTPAAAGGAAAGPETSVCLDVHSFELGERLRFALVERSDLRVGGRYEGPMVIREPTTTTYVDAGFQATVDPSGALMIRRAAVQPSAAAKTPNARS